MATTGKRIKKINPNEYGSLVFDHQELDAILHAFFNGKIFRYASKGLSVVDLFEQEVKKYFGVQFALGFNNGTSALRAALKAVGIQANDRVLISAFTFIATPASVISFGAIPVPIDFDLQHGMNLTQLEKELKKGCRAVVIVHLQGRTFEIKPIINLGAKYKVPVIEDACQAFGSKGENGFAGRQGDIGIFSFQQYKQVSSGEGGLLISNNPQYHRRAKIYSDHGMVREIMSWNSDEAMIGDNLRMNNLQAAILRVQLKKLPKMILIQKKNSKYILDHLKIIQLKSIINSRYQKGETGMNIFFLTTSPDVAKEIISDAKKKKIEFRYLWDRPYYKYDVFTTLKLTPVDLGSDMCTSAEDIAQRLLSVSIPPTLTESSLNKIIIEIKRLHKLGLIS